MSNNRNEKKPKPNSRPVRLVETGEIFDSAHACAEELNVSHSTVLKCAHNRIGRCKGYHIEFVE